MSRSLKNYTLRYLASALLIVIAIWAGLFYAVLLDELYDNTDDGLKDLKIQIIRKAYIDEQILKIHEFDFNQFKINPVTPDEYKEGNYFRNELFYMEYDEEMEPYRILETYFIDPKGIHQKLEIRTSTVEEDDFTMNLFIALVFLYLFLVVSIVLINNIVLKNVWKPFYKTLNILGAYKFGKGNELEINDTEIKEFNSLNHEIDKMIKRNEASYIQQKNFIENASHELQTPLAIAINKLDLLIENEELHGNHIQALSETKNELVRLIKFNKSLLMLSRIENNQFGNRIELELNDVVVNVLEDFNDLIEFKQISLNISLERTFRTSINPDLAYIVVSNLIRNALKYTAPKGSLNISIATEGLKVKNSSLDGKALDPNLIFDRFYKTNQDKTSTGLGLSIVKTIIENHSDLSIEYSFEDYFHVFSIKTNNS